METLSSRLSRRQLLAASFGTALVSLPGQMGIANQTPDSAASDLLEIILTTQEHELAIDTLVEVFARSGIAVFDDAVTAPLIAPVAPISPLSFQRWQLSSMVEELASGTSRPAAAFDDLLPSTAEDGAAILTAGELLAGYYGGGDTPGAEFATAFLDSALPQNMHITAEDLPFPVSIASLLGGEILGQMYESLAEAQQITASSIGLSTTTQQGLSYRQVPDLSLPGLPQIPAVPEINLPAVPPLQGSTVCGLAQSFVSTVQQRIASVLQAAGKVASKIPIIGKIIEVVIDGVRIGLETITKAVDAALAPVTAVIKSIGAALGIASLIVGTISPWTVKLELQPSPNRFGIDAEVVTGEISVIAGGWDRIDFPPVIQECAQLAGLQLPEPTSKDSPAIVSVKQDLPLITLDATDLRLDDAGRATTTYVTGNESADQAKGTEVYGVAWIYATVEREDLKRLRDDLMNLLFSQLPDIIAKVVRPIIGPEADKFTNGIISLLSVRAQRILAVIYHDPPQDPDPAANGGTETEETMCVIGSYQMVDPAALIRVAFPGPAAILNEGSPIWTFDANGTVIADYNGYVLRIEGGPGAEFVFSFAGFASGTFVAEGGVITVTFTHSEVMMDADMIAIQDLYGSESSGGSVVGTYVCGGMITFPVDMAEYGTVNLELVPVG